MRTLDLAKKLIEFKSTLENKQQTQAIVQFVKEYVESETKPQLHSTIYTYNEFETLIIATKSLKNPKLTFYAHLDVVEGPEKSFIPKVEGDKLYGRGAGDMKGAAASLINAFIKLANSNPELDICLLLPTDEESGGQNCTKPLLSEYGFRTECILMPDSGSGLDTLITNQKGILFTEVEFFGKSSHGSRPWEGHSAIQELFDYAEKFKSQFPKPTTEYYSTANPSIISGGDSFNSVAQKAHLTLDIRTASKKDTQQTIELLKSLDSPHAKHNIRFQDSAFQIDPNHKYLQKIKEITEKITGKTVELKKEHGGSDGRFFQEYDIPCLVNGVAKKHTHGDDEYALIPEINMLEEIAIEFAKTF